MNASKFMARLIVIVGLFVGVYAAFIEPFSIRVTDMKLQTKKWPYENSLKIVMLADMHMVWPWMTVSHLQDIVDEVNQLNPDIVLLLGDYVATHPFGIQLDPFEALQPLDNIVSRCGTFAVLGNHDLHPKGDWPESLQKLQNVKTLVNDAERVRCGNRLFWIGGLDDYWYGNYDIKKTMEAVDNQEPILMAMHQPDLFPQLSNSIVASFAGHTHAGQIRFPLVGSIEAVVPSAYGERYAYGHINENNKDMFVTAGLGMTGLPLRFLNKPEIMVVEISSDKESD